MSEDIAKTWARIEQVLRQHAPEVCESLAPGAARAELDRCEAELGFHLPPELGQSWAVHNGQGDPSYTLRFCGFWGLMSVGDAIRWRGTLIELGERFDRENGVAVVNGVSLNSGWWKRSCIPFAHCEGDYLCVDMDPALGHEQGRVVVHIHDGLLEALAAPTFGAWLCHVRDCLEGGRFHRDEYGSFEVELEDGWR